MTNHEIPAEDLALYAVGALLPEEQQRVTAHLETCASCRTEVMKLRGDAALLALSAPPVAAPSRARQRLLGEIAKTAAPAQSGPRLGTPWWSMAFPTVVALGLLAFGFYMVGQNALLRHDLDRARMQAAQQQATVDEAKHVVETMTAQNAQRVTLVASRTKPQPQAQTIYQRDRGRLVLVASNLEPLPQKMTYELWILPMSGKAPIPAGMFKPDAKGNASLMMPQIPTGVEAKGFAVTVEPEGGSQTPTMPIKMLGMMEGE